MTETGLSLGTPHYMSPEQATAERDLSARSDVYSLACVLYEMLAGDPPHTGPTAQAILMRILTEAPRSVTDVRASVPPHVDAVLAKALQKLPADRFDSADAFGKALDDEGFTYTAPARKETIAAVAPTATPGRVQGIPLWLAATVGGALLLGGYGLARMTGPEPSAPPSAEFAIDPGGSHTIVSPCCGKAVAISAGGDRLVYQGIPTDGSTLVLYQRPLNQREAQPIPGTDGGRHPFFSPDGEWLGFFSGGSLLKVRFDGGTPLTVLTGIQTNAGGAWGPDNTIVYSSRGDPVLYRISADGGDARQVTALDSLAGEVAHRWPHVLPDGETVVFAVSVVQEDGESVEMLAGTHIDGGGHELLFPGADPRYAEPEFLVYSDAAGSIMAQAVDPATLEVTGARFRIAEQVTYRGNIAGVSEYDISRSGTIVYRQASGSGVGGERELVLVDVDGSVETLMTAGPIRTPRFSPDGRYIAYELEGDAGGAPDDIWVWDQDRANAIRITRELDNSFPVWSADGSRIFFETATSILARSADGSGETEVILEAQGTTAPFVSRDGEWLLWPSAGEGGFDIWARSLDGGDEARPIVQSDFMEVAPALSPDSRWLAYMSDDSGQREIYVEPFPELGSRFKVTTGGAQSPVWSPDGSTLYYRRQNAPSFDLVAVDVRAGERFDVGAPRTLFSTSGMLDQLLTANYDVHPDGDRFVFVRGEQQAATGDTHVVITNALNVGLGSRD